MHGNPKCVPINKGMVDDMSFIYNPFEPKNNNQFPVNKKESRVHYMRDESGIKKAKIILVFR